MGAVRALVARLGTGGLAPVAMVFALVLGAGASTSALGTSSEQIAGTPEPAPVVAAATPAPVPATEFASLEESRELPLDEVRDYFERVQRERATFGRVSQYRPLYDEAERVFGVSWRLIASIHRQETAFSAADSTYSGRNFAGCCAGPMQFNLTNGPPSTWDLYRDAHRSADRPASYPHRTARHPSVYDDFDAIMAAGMLLRDSGADGTLGASAWRAAYDYYGHDLFGVTYASQVTARALGWRRDGFCVNCLPDERLVAKLDRAYGEHERRQLGVIPQAPARKGERRERAGDAHEKRRSRATVSEAEPAPKPDRARARRPVAKKPDPTPTAEPVKPSKPARRPPRPTATATPPAATPESRPPDPEPTPGLLDGVLAPGS